MTAEVCIMNRLAVVLAADSAATVSRWSDNKYEERYFKGSNKIFQLSDHHPVGLMIFDSADVMRVPWEIVVKSFRGELGAKSFNTLKEYALEFFAYLERAPLMFPQSIQEEILLDSARSAAMMVIHRDEYSPDDEARLAENAEMVQARRDKLDAMPLGHGLDQDFVDNLIAASKPHLVQHIELWRETFGQGFPADIELLAEVGMLEVFKRPAKHLNTTGLVFAGFGDHDIFPAYAEFECCGLICGKHVASSKDDFSVTHDVPAKLASFAQTAMSDTFSLGVSEDVYGSLMATLSENLDKFTRSVIADSGGSVAAIPNFEEVVNQARRDMGAAILERAKQEHAYPLRRVLGVLPVDEMADLAETLINLQALKEKVTKSSETVGGPVDVAIITKSEGLVWVKRKHFFDVNLNSRYLVRQHNRLTA